MVNKPLLRPYFSWGVPEPWGPRLTGHDQLQVGPTRIHGSLAKFRVFFFTRFPLPGAQKKDEATIVALTVMKMGALDLQVIQLSNEQKTG